MTTTWDETARTARRAAVQVRHSSEDLVDGALLKIRRHPFAAVGIGFATGIAVGALFGLVMGQIHQETVIRRVARQLTARREHLLRELPTPVPRA